MEKYRERIRMSRMKVTSNTSSFSLLVFASSLTSSLPTFNLFTSGATAPVLTGAIWSDQDFHCWHIKSLCINLCYFNCGTFGFDLSRPRNSSRTSSSLAISKSSKSLKNKFKLVITMATSHPSKLLAVENLGRNHVALALLLFPALPHERPLVLKNIWPQALNCWNIKDLRTWFPGNIMSTSSKAIFLIWKCLPICVTYSIRFVFTCKTLWICCCSFSI